MRSEPDNLVTKRPVQVQLLIMPLPVAVLGVGEAFIVVKRKQSRIIRREMGIAW